MQAIRRQPQRAPDGAPVHYERHRLEQATLYRLVQQHAATFFAQAEGAAGADLPAIQALLGRSVLLPTLAQEQLLVPQAEPAEGGAPRVLATLRLQPSIGMTQPRCWYYVGCTAHAAPELGPFHRQHTLLLGHDHTGASELCDIAWHANDVPLDTQAAALRLLVASACLLVARDHAGYA